MINLHTALQHSSNDPKIAVDELLFVEYTCLQEETKFGIWSDSNYFAFISSGKKMWRTINQDYIVEEGDILFIKKGANLTHQFFGERFCALFIFIPDEFILNFLKKRPSLLSQEGHSPLNQDAVLRVNNDELLANYPQTIFPYFRLNQPPPSELIKLKFEELLLSLFVNEKHRSLTDYFSSLSQSKDSHLKQIMEANYAYNLKITEYAELCHMSVSTFKRSFQKAYQTTPAAWIKEKKLQHASFLLRTTDLPIGQLTLESGFESTSHFIRVFKERFLVTPSQYR